jgi:endonuclease/exonuclease/phosphatase (EEP) superfamily protein YafD
VIVGGDFNAPPTDDALAAFRQRLSDSFLTAGHGWGATGTNEYALFRVDQIWVSDGLQPASVTAHKTQHSDHRMVVCDLKLHQ